MSWNRIIEDINIYKKVEEIATILINLKVKTNNFSIFGGLSGIIIFLYYYYSLTLDDKYRKKGDQLLELCFSSLTNDSYTFSSGLAGIAWTLEHLSQNKFININTNNILQELDEILFQKLQLNFHKKNIDFLHGGLGYTLYFLKRHKNTNDNIKIKYIVNEIEKSAIKNNNIKWVNNFNSKGKNNIDMGMAHGMAGILVILSKLFNENDTTDNNIKDLIEGAFKFYTSNKLPESCLSIYPYQSDDIKYKKTSRLAWCYGDLGVASSLYFASKTIKNNKILNYSLEIFKHASKRKNLIENSVFDACICHGSSGIAHIFNRIYQKTHEEIFKETAIYWVNETVKMATFNNGIAGFKTWQNKYQRWINDYSFLEGITGIGLVLLSTISDIEPTWDESLLLS